MNKPINLLLVDDNPGDIELLKLSMKNSKHNFKVQTAEDGEKAYDFLFNSDPKPNLDLILLDLNMPKISGTDILKTLKGNPRYQNTPVLILTSSESKKDMLLSYELNANAYITKPSSLSQFPVIVENIYSFFENYSNKQA